MTRTVTHRRRSRCVALVLLGFVLVALAGAGIAGAYLSAPAAPSFGVATVAGRPTLTATAVPGVAALSPGASVDLTIMVRNAAAAPVRIDALALDTSRGVGGFASDQPACTTPALSLATQTNGATGWTVPARAGGVDGQQTVTLASALSMGAAASSACQRATFTVYLVAS